MMSVPPSVTGLLKSCIEQTLDTATMQTFEYRLDLPDGPQELEARLVTSGPNEVLAIVRPVIEKVASIAATYLQKFDDLEKICLVGGTCELEGFADIVADNIGLETFQPDIPQLITPFGIALSCLDTRTDGYRGA